jgi:histidinol-phosphate aminotransferase
MFESDLVRSISPYIPSSYSQIFKGSDRFLKLDWNESTRDPSPLAIQAMIQYLKTGKINWYPEQVNHQLLEKIASYCHVSKNNVQLFAGADALLECVAKTFLSKGDTFLLTSPTYDNMRAVAQLSNPKIIKFLYQEQNRFSPDLDQLHKQIKDVSPKLVYICNPNNPTTTSYTCDQIGSLISSFPRTLFLIDEAYYEFDGVTATSLIAKQYNNILIARTFSKAFALAGLRIGYGIGATQLIESLNKVRNVKSVSSIAQIGAAACLDDLSYMQAYVDEVRRAKKLLKTRLDQLTHVQSYSMGGNFLTMKVQYKNELIRGLIQSGIFVRDLKYLDGLEEYIRVTIGSEKEMRHFLYCLERCMSQSLV